ncbi:serine/threonine-protein kinase [Allocoleopsis franciscana]|uniref:non-specific serine/threonine protein kinase n=1 Tax=Allocoleopsis franciscana PCC 7113 TaxID=1173027 RepID=K9WCK3_9CYAN|nr:serine/threonine-protein kinase [Allocoleopsis franciscana]AFZ17257.1 serine/threonine protein kinase [Allocoleopsis franciscana PCC 7113]
MTPTLLNNRYRILRTLGAGGFGNTFLAEDTYMPSGRRCVIKQLKPVTHDPQAYKIVQERFGREAAVLEALGDGNNQIPRLFAYFSEAGQFYLVQEYIEGDTLTQKVEKGGVLSENEVKQILVSLLPVLDYVHSQRMIHRDIKPDNVIIRQRDRLPVLIDFGAVKEAMNTQVNLPGNQAHSMVIGTPGFMPAEQAGGRPTYTSDLYSLGLVAVFLLTGKLPQELGTDDRTGEFLWRRTAPNINPNLAMVIDRAIRFNASDRFATAREMLNALQSGDGVSEMATLAVAPGGLPATPNRSTPPIANPSPGHTVPVGSSPALSGKGRKPLIIGALVAGSLFLAVVGLALGLRRGAEPASTVSSSSDPSSERTTTQQPSSSTSSRSQSTNSDPTSEQPTTQQPSSSTSSRSRSQPSDSNPTSERTTTQPRQGSTPVSGSQAGEITPSPVLPNSSSSERSPQGRASKSIPSPELSPSQSSFPPQSIPVPLPEAGNTNQNSEPSRRIPAFPAGTQQSYIKEELGQPSKASKGMWNTRALLYEDFVPGQASLGYLYDPSSGRVRQTEVSFSDSVDMKTMSRTLNQLLNGNASADIKQGLEAVYQQKSNRYRFVSGRNNSLKGVIERNEPGRIYVAVWEADLH